MKGTMMLKGFVLVSAVGAMIGVGSISAATQNEKGPTEKDQRTVREKVSYSFVVKRTPDGMDPDEVDADWKTKPHYPEVLEWKTRPDSKTTWRLNTWHQATGTEKSRLFDTTEGQTAVRFGGKTKLLLQKRTSKGGKFVDETTVECSMDLKWTIDPATGEITNPPGPSLDDANTARKGISQARLKAGIGLLRGFVGAGFQEKDSRGEWQSHTIKRDTTFYWEVYKRKTTQTLDEDGKVVETERVDTLVSLSDSEIRLLEGVPAKVKAK